MNIDIYTFSAYLCKCLTFARVNWKSITESMKAYIQMKNHVFFTLSLYFSGVLFAKVTNFSWSGRRSHKFCLSSRSLAWGEEKYTRARRRPAWRHIPPQTDQPGGSFTFIILLWGIFMVESESIHEGVKYACNQCDYQGSKEALRCHLKTRHSMTQLAHRQQTNI